MAATDRRFLHVRVGDGTAYSLIGELITFKVTSAETGDTFSITELISQPQGGPPLHTHPAAEAFIILEGMFEFSGLDQGSPYTIRATPGDIVYIPGGAPHTYKTISPTTGKALGVLAPGGEMERFFAEVGTPASDTTALAMPSEPPSGSELAQHMAIAGRHGIVFFPPRVDASRTADPVASTEARQGDLTGE
jgi:quercetin dioxygenase-like cupin family protein